MRVDEPRQHRVTAGVDLLCARSGRVAGLSVVTDRDDPIAADRDRLGRRPRGVDRPHPRVADHQVHRALPLRCGPGGPSNPRLRYRARDAALILDVDTGVDDSWRCSTPASPEVDLIGATCVTGNVHVDSVTRNTLVTLELAGAGDVEVARGADTPLVGARWTRSRLCTGPRDSARTCRRRRRFDLGS